MHKSPALLDELEQLIQQKKKEMMGGSLDIRIEGGRGGGNRSKRNSSERWIQKENNKFLPSILTSPERSNCVSQAPLEALKSKFSSSNSPEDAVETNKTKTCLPVDEGDLLKV